MALVDPTAAPIDPAAVLHAILLRRSDGEAAEIDEPLIPLLDTTLLTNAPGDPTLWSQLFGDRVVGRDSLPRSHSGPQQRAKTPARQSEQV
jgi:hypothetical protein